MVRLETVMPDSKMGKNRRGGKSAQADDKAKSDKGKSREPEFKEGDTVIFNVRSTDEVDTTPAVAIADSLFKKQK